VLSIAYFAKKTLYLQSYSKSFVNIRKMITFESEEKTYSSMFGIYDSINPVETEEAVMEEVIDNGDIAELIVYNDDFNTFDWVIKCFVEILQHSPEQAEQLSLIVHYKGKATVKTASLPVLRPLRNALVDRGLSAVIESLQD